MNDEMNSRELLEICTQQEKELQFDSFGRNDIWELGCMLVESTKACKVPVAVEIRVGRELMFCYYPEGTPDYYRLMLRKKYNTVQMMGKSSLHFFAEMQVMGLDPEKDMGLDPKEYVCAGGGFPICLRSGLQIGTIAASGMSPVEDHMLIVNTLKKYLGKAD